MYKIAGAVMVASAGAYMGISAALGLKRRAQILRGFETALGIMAGEVAERLTPLGELAAMLADNPAPQVGAFFAALATDHAGAQLSFARRWREGLRRIDPALSSAALDELDSLGHVLGRYSAAYQGEMIKRAAARLGQQAQAAEADAAGRGKMLSALGLCGGLAVGILLL